MLSPVETLPGIFSGNVVRNWLCSSKTVKAEANHEMGRIALA